VRTVACMKQVQVLFSDLGKVALTPLSPSPACGMRIRETARRIVG
jgi:hypothetical protein